MADDSQKQEKKSVWRIYYIFTIFIALLIDQISKWMVTEMIMRSAQKKGDPVFFFEWLADPPSGKLEYMSFEILPFYNIVMVWNYGVSFGLFNNHSSENALLLSGVAVIIAFFLILWMLDTPYKYVGLALAMTVGGALGNVVDRMRFGAVIDFIDIHVAGYHWPAFNVADSCVVIGILFVIVHALFFEKNLHEKPKE